MAQYLIKELQDMHSYREGRFYEGTLRGAKMIASRDQCFYGTALRIENYGGGVAAYKPAGKPWVDTK